MKMTRHNGRAGKNGTYNPKHNDRRFNLENSEHIDAERARKNIYWDIFNGYRSFADMDKETELADTFEDVEQLYYSHFYRDFVEGQNRRNEKNRHTERNRSTDDIRKNKKTCPEESLFQIGTMDDHAPPEVLLQVALEFMDAFEKRFGSHIHILDWALHALHRFLGAPEDDFSYEVLKLFMMGCIERVYHPGCKFDYMLCLVGGQGAGKSSFFRLLAIHDEWFSDDLKKLDDDNVYRKMSGHWIIEMSEMLGIGTAKSTDEIKSFLSRQKETYKDPYDKYARDRLRQCVFGGTTNRMDFLPLDRTGNRRFLPILVDMDKAEVHLLENEAESRAYMLQMWAEAMELFQRKEYELKFPECLEAQLLAIQKECMPDDSMAGIIQVFLDQFKGEAVCTLQLYREALKHPFDRPTNRESRELNDIMNNSVIGWKKCKKQRRIPGYGQQRAWERDGSGQSGTINVNEAGEKYVNHVNESDGLPDGFEPVPEQMELPF